MPYVRARGSTSQSGGGGRNEAERVPRSLRFLQGAGVVNHHIHY
jgi:hypothetical protein